MRALLGVNLPYFYGSYGHDLAPSARWPEWPCDFDLLKAYRPLLEARELGLGAVRIWLCEGAEGLVLGARGEVEGVHPRLLESIRLLEEGARVVGVRIYWTLLDANAASRDGDVITRAILGDAAQSERFASRVVAPIARAMDPEIAVGLEIVNEPEVVTESCADVRAASVASIEWQHVGRAIGLASRAARAERPELLVTAGSGHAFLPKLWATDAELGAIDVHMYHSEGGLPTRAELLRYAGVAPASSVPILAGECGVPKPCADPATAFSNFVINADKQGYDAAFLWKLDGDLVDARDPKRSQTAVARALADALKARPAAGYAF